MTPASLRLSIVVPTLSESENVGELLRRLEITLGPIGWEIVFVDDDSPDGTASLVRDMARKDSRVRCLQRVGRRGLSSACIEGMLATAAPVIAIMDADLQHDEAILPKMLAAIEAGDADLVVGTRYSAGGSAGHWSASRKAMSRFATIVSHLVLKHSLSDPMSGFFMLRRDVLESIVRDLSGLGFKILLDILATAKQPLRVAELPYRFRVRFSGTSKLDEMVVWEYGMLLLDKLVGRFLPIRFVSFSLVGSLGVLVHLAAVGFFLRSLDLGFVMAQSAATGIAMIFNFAVNNLFTYRDQRFKGKAWFKGLLSFMAACSIGALANVGVATYLFKNRAEWIIAALAGVLVSAVWNYAVTQEYTWRKK
jgi:dolichol-phosphate mannosyltransferase